VNFEQVVGNSPALHSDGRSIDPTTENYGSISTANNTMLNDIYAGLPAGNFRNVLRASADSAVPALGVTYH